MSPWPARKVTDLGSTSRTRFQSLVAVVMQHLNQFLLLVSVLREHLVIDTCRTELGLFRIVAEIVSLPMENPARVFPEEELTKS